MHREQDIVCMEGRNHKLKLQCHLQEDKREDIHSWPGTLQDQGKTHNLKNSATGGCKRCIQARPEKASESIAGLMKGTFTLKAVSKNWRRKMLIQV